MWNIEANVHKQEFRLQELRDPEVYAIRNYVHLHEVFLVRTTGKEIINYFCILHLIKCLKIALLWEQHDKWPTTARLYLFRLLNNARFLHFNQEQSLFKERFFHLQSLTEPLILLNLRSWIKYLILRFMLNQIENSFHREDSDTVKKSLKPFPAWLCAQHNFDRIISGPYEYNTFFKIWILEKYSSWLMRYPKYYF